MSEPEITEPSHPFRHPDHIRFGIRKKGSSIPRFIDFPFLRGLIVLPVPGEFFRLPTSEDQWYEAEERLLDYRDGVIEIRCVEVAQ